MSKLKAPHIFKSSISQRLVWSSLVVFLLLSVGIARTAQWKVLGISWIALAAMIGGIPWGIHDADGRHITIASGLSSGAMITSAAIFLAPVAIQLSPAYGGLGIAAGMILGSAIHTVNHKTVFSDLGMTPIVVELIFHTLTAGLIIGMLYAEEPDLSVILGIAVISHKGPAAYAAARRLQGQKKSPWLLLLPAFGVGLTALPISLIHIGGSQVIKALIFGFATGIFFHMASDFLPTDNVVQHLNEFEDNSSNQDLNINTFSASAVMSTFAGAFIVFALWLIAH